MNLIYILTSLSAYAKIQGNQTPNSEEYELNDGSNQLNFYTSKELEKIQSTLDESERKMDPTSQHSKLACDICRHIIAEFNFQKYNFPNKDNSFVLVPTGQKIKIGDETKQIVQKVKKIYSKKYFNSVINNFCEDGSKFLNNHEIYLETAERFLTKNEQNELKNYLSIARNNHQVWKQSQLDSGKKEEEIQTFEQMHPDKHKVPKFTTGEYYRVQRTDSQKFEPKHDGLAYAVKIGLTEDPDKYLDLEEDQETKAEEDDDHEFPRVLEKRFMDPSNLELKKSVTEMIKKGCQIFFSDISLKIKPDLSLEPDQQKNTGLHLLCHVMTTLHPKQQSNLLYNYPTKFVCSDMLNYCSDRESFELFIEDADKVEDHPDFLAKSGKILSRINQMEKAKKQTQKSQSDTPATQDLPTKDEL